MSNAVEPTPDPTTEKPPRPRRWIPLSLRMFIAILLLLGLCGALWIGVPVYRQCVAVREIERLGGKVRTELRFAPWIRDRFGEEWGRLLDKAVWVDLDDAHVMDATLGYVGCLSDLKLLSLLDTHGVTNDGLARLGGLTSLRILDMKATEVTDTGLAHLNGFALDRLTLDDMEITDDGVTILNGMSELTHLVLRNTRVTDAGLIRLKGIRGLKLLDLSGKQITDAGLLSLKELTNLKVIGLINTQVTDAGIAELKRALPKLEIVK
jgi:hypothetical protein